MYSVLYPFVTVTDLAVILSAVGNNVWLWLLISHQPAAYLGIVLATTESDVASESAFAALCKPISLLSSSGQS